MKYQAASVYRIFRAKRWLQKPRRIQCHGVAEWRNLPDSRKIRSAATTPSA